MSTFYNDHVDQLPQYNKIHEWFKKYESNGSIIICGHNVNWGFSAPNINELNDESIKHIENYLIQNFIQGEIIINHFENTISYGWWAIVK